MSALTQNERDGLEDIFCSIHTPNDKYKKIKEISTLIMSYETNLNIKKLLKQAKDGIKEAKLSQYILKLTKRRNS